MAHEIIISCCQEDLEPAEAALHALESAGYDCWLDTGVKGKKGREKSFIKALRTARVIVVVFSADTSETALLANDMNMALNAGLKIIPLRVAKAEPTAFLQYYLADTHWLDFDTTPGSDQVSLLTEAVKTALLEPRSKGMVKTPHGQKPGLFYPWPVNIAVTVTLALAFFILFALGSFLLADSLNRLIHTVSALIITF